jgi:hypothetical protein
VGTLIADNEAWHGGSDGQKYSLGIGSSSGQGAWVHRFVVARNWYHVYNYVGDDTAAAHVFYLANTEDFMIRNNIIDCSSQTDQLGSCKMVNADDRIGGEPDPKDTFIFNNTIASIGYETSDTGIIRLDTSVNTDVRANLVFMDPIVGNPNVNLFTGSGAPPDVDQDNLSASSDPFVNGRLGMTNPEDMKLSTPDDVTTVTGVRRDFSGAVRTGNHTRGAWDY